MSDSTATYIVGFMIVAIVMISALAFNSNSYVGEIGPPVLRERCKAACLPDGLIQFSGQRCYCARVVKP